MILERYNGYFSSAIGIRSIIAFVILHYTQAYLPEAGMDLPSPERKLKPNTNNLLSASDAYPH